MIIALVTHNSAVEAHCSPLVLVLGGMVGLLIFLFSSCMKAIILPSGFLTFCDLFDLVYKVIS